MKKRCLTFFALILIMFTGLSEGCSKEKKEQNTLEEYTKIAGKAPGNFSYNINWQNSLGVYSISENLAVSFNGDILSDVTMPKGLSDVIRTYVKRSSLGVESDIALPLVYHFSELQKKGALNDESKERKEVYALRALYTLNEAYKTGRFNDIKLLVESYTGSVK